MDKTKSLAQQSVGDAVSRADDGNFEPNIFAIARNAKQHPHRLAVIAPEGKITYGDLNTAANRLAHKILAMRGQREEPVVYLSGLEIDTVTAVLGITKTAKFHVGLDPSNPVERLKAILDDTGAKLLITNQANLPLAHQICGDSVDIINLSTLESDLPSEDPQVHIGPETKATIFYTSGSTGKPKGLLHSHGARTFGTARSIKSQKHTSDDRMLLFMSLAFGMGVARIDLALVSGATLYLRDHNSITLTELVHWLANEKITVLLMTPSLFSQFLVSLPENSPEKYPHLRLIILSGEVFNPHDLEAWKKHFSPHCLLFSLYGASEAGLVASTQYTFQTELTNGGALFSRVSSKVFILDDGNQPLPAGAIGRIAVRNPDASSGYWRRPDLNEQLFVPDPENPEEKIIALRDLGRLHPDGTLEYMGREDAMLKIRGFRVEPGEVEAALQKHPAVQANAVAGRQQPGKGQDLSLVAYIVTRPGHPVSDKELRDFLTTQVPYYMVPAYYLFLDKLPTMPNGKVDRQGLPEPDWVNIQSQDFLAPETDLEKYLVQLWAQVLVKERVGITDDFFMLGGHSLAAFGMMAEIQNHLGVKVPLNTLVKYPTIRTLAKAIETMEISPTPASITTIRKAESGPSFFAVPAAAQTSVALAKFFDSKTPFGVYGLEYPGMDGHLAPLDTIEDLAAFFVKQIQSVQPQGPYWLAGQCIGGIIAFEIAHQLVKQGHEIGLIVIIDSTPPKMRDPEFFQEEGYYTKRLKKFLNPLNWGALIPYFAIRLRRRKPLGLNLHTPGIRRANRLPDEASVLVYEACGRARKRYEPSKLNASGLALLNSRSRVSQREAVWRNLYAELESHYIPNTTHKTIFNAPSSIEKIHQLIGDAVERALPRVSQVVNRQ